MGTKSRLGMLVCSSHPEHFTEEDKKIYEWIDYMFGDSYDVKLVSELTIAKHPWENSTAAIILGGDTTSLGEMCNLRPETKAKIRSYINAGGVYVGIGAGSSFGCKAYNGKLSAGDLLYLLKLRSVDIANEGAKVDLILKSHSPSGTTSVSGEINITARNGDNGIFLLANAQNSPACESAKCVHACYSLKSPDSRLKGYGCMDGTSVPATIIYKLGEGTCMLCGVQLHKIYSDLADDSQIKLYHEFVSNLFSNLGLFVSKCYIPATEPNQHAPVCMCAVLPAGCEWFDKYIQSNNPSKVENQEPGAGACGSLEYVKLSSHPLYPLVYASKIPQGVAPSDLVGPLAQFCENGNMSPVLYLPEVDSTQTLLEQDSTLLGLIPDFFPIVSSIQTKGRGRSSNKWSTPYGCIAFSFALSDAGLHDKLYIIQHIVAISISAAISQLCNFVPGASVCLKWPNDICISHEGAVTKIGGVIISVKEVEGVVKYVIGCGVNTHGAIKSLTYLSEYIRGDKSKVANVPEFLSCFFSSLKSLLGVVAAGSLDLVKFFYTSCWIHSDSHVLIHPSARADILQSSPDVVAADDNESKGIMARITDIDDCGFLLAEDIHGNKYTFKPDGNAFDLKKSMIYEKL